MRGFDNGLISVRVQQPVLDAGDKYVQPFLQGHTDSATVHRSQRNPNIGVRMEDVLSIDDVILGKRNIFVSIISDGHGSIPLTPFRYAGGAEIAHIATKFLAHTLRTVLIGQDPETLKNAQKMSNIFKYAFEATQKHCLEEFMKGARIVDPNSQSSPYGRYKRNQVKRLDDVQDESVKESLMQLFDNEIDGRHFIELWTKGEQFWTDLEQASSMSNNSNNNTNNFGSLDDMNDTHEQQEHDPLKNVVTDKIAVKYKDAQTGQDYYGLFYVNQDGIPISEPLDCGATVCALVIVEDIAYVAHVGDTGAFLFYCDDPTIEPKWKSTRLYDEHSVHSERERQRLQEHGASITEHHFSVEITGPPPSHAITKLLMPSRALGHPIFTHHGISVDPVVYSTKLQPGDVIVAATDGLWDVQLPQCPPEMQTCTGMHLTRYLLQKMLSEKQVGTNNTQYVTDGLPERVVQFIRKHGYRRDNLAMLVVEISQSLETTNTNQ